MYIQKESFRDFRTQESSQARKEGRGCSCPNYYSDITFQKELKGPTSISRNIYPKVVHSISTCNESGKIKFYVYENNYRYEPVIDGERLLYEKDTLDGTHEKRKKLFPLTDQPTVATPTIRLNPGCVLPYPNY